MLNQEHVRSTCLLMEIDFWISDNGRDAATGQKDTIDFLSRGQSHGCSASTTDLTLCLSVLADP